jgi:hypothetical protein
VALIKAADIRINFPGDADWVMARVHGVSGPSDQSLMRHREGVPVGGVVLCQFLGASLTCHMAGEAGWLSRTLLWMMFDYAFVQLGVRKVIALVRSNNYAALTQDLRAGFRVEAIVRDVFPDAHMLILTMEKATCPWLNVKPQGWKSGHDVREKEMA